MTPKECKAISDAIKAARVDNITDQHAQNMHRIALDCVAEYIAMNLAIDDPTFNRVAFVESTKRDNHHA